MKDRESLSHLLAVGLEMGMDEVDHLDFSDIPDGNWRFGGYELLEEIGRGGMGVIYRARQPFSNRIVALKRLLPLKDSDKEAAQRLQREAQTVARLDHPNILPVFEVGTGEDGLPFFSMKLAGGGSLSDALKRSETSVANPRKWLEFMVKVSRAVQYAHGEDVLHRDLKPGNILLDGQGEPLVADFGLAKWLDRPSDFTHSLAVFGTPGYLAPEQAAGSAKAVGKTADIYSLGAILFELLAGRPPFIGKNAWEVVREASEIPAPKLRLLVADASRDLETICARCLEREPAARYKNAGDLADDLQRCLDGRPIIARPVSPAERTWRWTRRNRTLAGTGFLCVLLAGTGTGWLFQKQRLEQQMRLQNLADHAVVVLPIFDLDEVKPHSLQGKNATSDVVSALKKAGRQLKPYAGTNGWTRKFASETKGAEAPFLIAGVTRKTSTGRKYTLHWYDARHSRFTHRVMAINTREEPDFLQKLVERLEAGSGEVLPENDPDDNSANQQASDLLAAGEEYFSRFTVASLDQSILCARKALRADPKFVRAYALLAVALMNRSWCGVEDPREFEAQADAAIAKATQLAPQSAAVYQAKGKVAFLLGRLEEGSEATLTSLELGMDLDSAGRTMALISKLYGRSDLALNWFSLVRVFARSQDYLSLVGDTYSDLGMDVESAAHYEKFADLFPDQPDGRLGLCELKLLNGEFAGGREMIDGLLQDFPTQSYPPLIAAQEAFYSREFPRAAQLYGKLMEADRRGGAYFYGSISYLSGRGFSLLQMGQAEEGRRLLEEARQIELDILKNEPDQPDHLNSLAATEAGLGNDEAALKVIGQYKGIMAISRRAIERDPRFDTLRGDPRFQENLATMTGHIAMLRRQVASEIAAPKTNQK